MTEERFEKGEFVYLTVGRNGQRDATVVDDQGGVDLLIVMRASRHRGRQRRVLRAELRRDRRGT